MSDRKLTRADLSKDQAAVYETMFAWAKTGRKLATGQPDILSMGGYAGTGKTTLLSLFAAETKLLVAYVTFTGRASSVLQRKLKASHVKTTTKTRPATVPGKTVFDERYQDPELPLRSGPAFVGTIHRLLYIPVVDPRTEELTGWRKREKLDREYDLIVIDEASMVGAAILDDLKVHDTPILAVGDHGQLPPVMDSGELMQNPDLRLEKIHRQAEGNPIIHLSRVVRETGFIDFDLADGKHIAVWHKREAHNILSKLYRKNIAIDIGVLCWTNRTRIRLNATARGALKRKGIPTKGELVISLRNAPPIYNGMRGVLTDDSMLVEDDQKLCANVKFPEEGLEAQQIDMCAAQFNRERPFASVEEMQSIGLDVDRFSDAGHLYDFGFALSVHRSQGSQFKTVVFYLDRSNDGSEDAARFFYTGITRASEKLALLT